MEIFAEHIPNAAVLPNSYYHNSTKRLFAAQSLDSDNSYDIAIIGGGFTGIGAALELAESGVSVCLIDALEIGSGASGRNGGLVCSGFRHDQKWLEAKMGVQAAKDLWAISQAAKDNLENLITKYSIDAEFKKGLIFAAHRPALMEWLREDGEHLYKNYNYSDIELLSQEKCAQALGSNAYFGGFIDKGAGKIHPLKLIYGMAKAAINNGAKIYENTRALAIDGNIIKTTKGNIKAEKILICGDGYIEGVNKKLDAKILPIGNFVIATEPLDIDILSNAAGGMDTRFVVNYFHKTNDNRLIFGGGEKYSAKWPNDIGAFVRKNMLKIFPNLSGVKIDYAWGGAVGITPTRLPYVRKIGKNIYTSAGYSGQGVLLAPFFGKIMGNIMTKGSKEFDTLVRMPVPDFPGGRALRFPLLTAALSYYSLLDKLP